MRVVNCEQGSAQWLQIRTGKITASRVAECLSKYKSLGPKKDGTPRKNDRSNCETAERMNYRIDLIVERLTGRSTENFVSPEMIWGRDNEDAARIAYELSQDVMTERVGFILHPSYDFCGASPDSLVGNNGGLEIKAPKSATHWKWRREKVVPEEYQPQCLLNMLCAEREWWDFCSFDPRLPEGANLFIVRMHRDEERIKAMEEEMLRLDEEIESEIASEGLVKWKPPVELPEESALPAPDPSQWAAAFDEFMQGEVIP